jgi:hypothetical protein
MELVTGYEPTVAAAAGSTGADGRRNGEGALAERPRVAPGDAVS